MSSYLFEIMLKEFSILVRAAGDTPISPDLAGEGSTLIRLLTTDRL
jgi:hypothetical protein